MSEKNYYNRGYELGKERASNQDDIEDNARLVSEMMDKLIYQPEAFKIFSIGFIHGFGEMQNTQKEYTMGYDLGYRIGFSKPFPQEEHEWVEQALQTLHDEKLDTSVFSDALHKGIEDGKRDDAETRD